MGGNQNFWPSVLFQFVPCSLFVLLAMEEYISANSLDDLISVVSSAEATEASI